MTYEFVGTHQGISVSAIVGFDTVDRLPARG
jgi:hypothetical protein